MNYQKTVTGSFISRPNRFIAHVEVNGEEKVCHVKNTGRCRELLIPGARVILEKASSATRKTEYDLIAVYKGDRLINIDSQAPNRVFGEWAIDCGFFGSLRSIRPEYTYKSSRFDFYLTADGKNIFVEVKGVTLEKDGVVLFPDAPTERGVKHLKELCDAVKNGYKCYVFFVIQMEECSFFTPNAETHRQFADALREAHEAGVNIRAMTCNVTESSLSLNDFVDVVI